MRIFIDIDETVCVTPVSRDYRLARPIGPNITKANALYDAGHHITYWTARGTTTGIDWRALTERQLRTWGAKYHELRMGKPAYDVFIDDKVLNSRRWTTDNVERVLRGDNNVVI